MGATPEPIGAVDDLVAWRGGDPPGDDVDVRLDCWAAVSNRLKLLLLEDGEALLFARDRCWGCVFEEGPGPAACWV